MASARSVVLDVYRIDAVRQAQVLGASARIVVLSRVKSGSDACPWAKISMEFPAFPQRDAAQRQDINTDISPSMILPQVTMTPIPVSQDQAVLLPIFVGPDSASCQSKLVLSPGPISGLNETTLPDFHAVPPMTLVSERDARGLAVEGAVNLSQYVLEFAGPAGRDALVPQSALDSEALLSPARVRRIVLSAGRAVYLTSFFTVLRTSAAEPALQYLVPLRDPESYAAFDAQAPFERIPQTPILERRQNLSESIAERLDIEAARALGFYNAFVQTIRRMYASRSPDVAKLIQDVRAGAFEVEGSRRISISGIAYVPIMALVNGTEPFSSAKTVLRLSDPAARVDDATGWYYLAAMIFPEADDQVQRYAAARTISTTILALGVDDLPETRYQRAFLAWLIVRYALMALAPTGAPASVAAYEKMCVLFVRLTDLLFSNRAWYSVLDLATGIQEFEWARTLPQASDERRMAEGEMLLGLCSLMYSIRREWLAQGLRNGLALAAALAGPSQSRARLLIQDQSPSNESLLRRDILAALESRSELPAAAFHGRLNREGDWPSLIAWASRAPVKCRIEGVSEIGEDPGDFVPVAQDLLPSRPRRRPRDESEDQLVVAPPMALEPATNIVDIQEQTDRAVALAVQQRKDECAEIVAERDRLIASLRAEAEISRAEAETLKLEIQQLRATAADPAALLAATAAKDRCLSSLEAKTQEADRLRAEVDVLKKKFDDAADDQREAQKTYENLEQQYKAQIASIQQDLNGQIERCQAQLSECSDRARRFEADVTRCARSAGEKVTGVIRGLRTQQQGCREQLRAVSSRANRLQARVNDLEARAPSACGGQRSQILALQQQIDVLKAQLKTSAAQIAELREKDAELEKQNTELRRRTENEIQVEAQEDAATAALVAALNDQLNRLHIDRDAAYNEVGRTTAIANECSQNMAEVSARFDAARAEIDALRQENRDSMEVRDESARAIDRLLAERDELEATIGRLRQDLASAAGISCDQVVQEYEARLQRQKDDFEARLRALQDEADQRITVTCGSRLSNAVQELQQRHLAEFASLREQYQQSLATLESQLATCQTREQELRSQAERALAQLEALALENQTTSAFADASLEARLAALKGAVNQDQFAQTSDQIGKCETEVAELKNQQAALRRAVDAAQAMASRIDQQNEALRARNDELTQLSLGKLPPRTDARPGAASRALFEGQADVSRILRAALLDVLLVAPKAGKIAAEVSLASIRE